MKNFLSKVKGKLTIGATAAVMAVTSVVSASAAGETGLSTYSEQITTQFQNAANDITPIIISILGVGLGIFAIFKGIKLAKKMFGTVSNG